MANILINGIVSMRDKQPYLQIDIDGKLAQLSMADARNIARDIEVMCARTEADAMIHKFFSAQGFPKDAGAALMLSFRDFRSQLDAESVEKSESDPDAPPKS
jgi:hypothetical protein